MGFATLVRTPAGLAAISDGAAEYNADTVDIGPGDFRERTKKAVGTGAAEHMLRRLLPDEVLRVMVLARQFATAVSCDVDKVGEEESPAVMNDLVAKLAPLIDEGRKDLAIELEVVIQRQAGA
jgi:hypothetical protein